MLATEQRRELRRPAPRDQPGPISGDRVQAVALERQGHRVGQEAQLAQVQAASHRALEEEPSHALLQGVEHPHGVYWIRSRRCGRHQGTPWCVPGAGRGGSFTARELPLRRSFAAQLERAPSVEPSRRQRHRRADGPRRPRGRAGRRSRRSWRRCRCTAACGGTRSSMPGRGAALLGERPDPAVGGDAADDDERVDALLPAGPQRLAVTTVSATASWKRRRDVGDRDPGVARRGDVARHRRLQAREGEAERRVALAHERPGEADARPGRRRGHRSIDGPPG